MLCRVKSELNETKADDRNEAAAYVAAKPAEQALALDDPMIAAPRTQGYWISVYL